MKIILSLMCCRECYKTIDKTCNSFIYSNRETKKNWFFFFNFYLKIPIPILVSSLVNIFFPNFANWNSLNFWLNAWMNFLFRNWIRYRTENWYTYEVTWILHLKNFIMSFDTYELLDEISYLNFEKSKFMKFD